MAGRKPFITTDVAPYGMGKERLRPPDTLGEPEKRAFVDLVLSVPASQFRKCDLPLLCRWSQLTVMAEQAAGERQAQGMVVDGKQSPWFAIHQSACRELRALAGRLKLGPSSRVSRAPKTLPAGNISYYERMRLAGELDDKPT